MARVFRTDDEPLVSRWIRLARAIRFKGFDRFLHQFLIPSRGAKKLRLLPMSSPVKLNP